jgi:hypothetical protein
MRARHGGQGWAASGIEDIFACRNGEGRAIVLIEMLQRQVKAELLPALLETA